MDTDLEDVVITADALRCQAGHVAYLRGRGARLLVCAKGSQPGLLKRLKALPWTQVPAEHASPAGPTAGSPNAPGGGMRATGRSWRVTTSGTIELVMAGNVWDRIGERHVQPRPASATDLADEPHCADRSAARFAAATTSLTAAAAHPGQAAKRGPSREPTRSARATIPRPLT